MKRIFRVLSIAGSDSGGGAGIQADIKTFAALGVHGMTAITSITAQNTTDVTAIQDVKPDVIQSQIEAVSQDIGVDAAKTGMLHTSEIISVVAKMMAKYGFPTVVDPVMISKSGARLLKPDAIDTLLNKLLPKATVLTPNAMEAEEKRGVAQHVADLQQPASALGGLHQPHTVHEVRGHRLFEQDIVARLEGSNGGFDVHAVLRADQRCFSHSGPGEEILPRAELALHGNGVRLGEACTADIVWLGHRDKADFLGMGQGKRAVGFVASVASTDEDGSERLGHVCSPERVVWDQATAQHGFLPRIHRWGSADWITLSV